MAPSHSSPPDPAHILSATVAQLHNVEAKLEAKLDYATRECGFRQVDLRDARCSDYQARQWGAVGPDFSTNTARLVGGDPTYVKDTNDIVALIASRADQALAQYDGSVYLRDRGLGQPIRHIARLLGTDRNRAVETVKPILARYLLRSAADLPTVFPNARIKKALLACLADPQVQKDWPGPCDAFVLGAPIKMDLPLGWSGGIQGTRHHRLGDLVKATVLRGVPTV